jgi:hypothetical protein
MVVACTVLAGIHSNNHQQPLGGIALEPGGRSAHQMSHDEYYPLALVKPDVLMVVADRIPALSPLFQNYKTIKKNNCDS